MATVSTAADCLTVNCCPFTKRARFWFMVSKVSPRESPFNGFPVERFTIAVIIGLLNVPSTAACWLPVRLLPLSVRVSHNSGKAPS